jgi:hypothetical protein
MVTHLNVSYSQDHKRVTVQPSAPTIIYPRITGYVGIVHPLISFDKDGTHKNFEASYTVGMPTGINLWKTSKVGFSFEVVPYIRAENGISKMSNFLFHPGILFALGDGYTVVGRAAFETSGRYGLTPILNKVIKKNKNSNYFLALPLPLRFGNDKPSSFGAAFQFGIGF